MLKITESPYTRAEMLEDACEQSLVDLDTIMDSIIEYAKQIQDEYLSLKPELNDLIYDESSNIDIQKATHFLHIIKPLLSKMRDIRYDISIVAEHRDGVNGVTPAKYIRKHI